ncbi:uncharacterized protein LOC120085312 isoform X3 [Benincasa hispida]|uniref:uncharacterized protein LOC120085312 isoform X3 n=1 Tax=Benincasa hispida TaxID=102211 RepID=UPI0019013D70|nr:uncharacterized protein LOC120085312 isoform X3 [Benincasa hispida]
MSGEAKRGGATGGAGGFRSRMEHYLYSGEKKHVAAGIVVIGIIFGIPWVLMNRGSKHQSHQDYMEKADKARSQRLSSVKSLKMPGVMPVSNDSNLDHVCSNLGCFKSCSLFY